MILNLTKLLLLIIPIFACQILLVILGLLCNNLNIWLSVKSMILLTLIIFLICLFLNIFLGVKKSLIRTLKNELIIIIIGTIVGAALAAVFVVKNRKTTQQELKIKAERKELPDVATKPVTPEIPKKPKKAKKEEIPSGANILTAAEVEEMRKTEKEVGVEEQEFICVVHKGKIDSAIYLCPHCRTFYCVKCAQTLKEKGEKCWSCENDINL